MVAGQIDHAEFARSLGRLGVASAMWPPLQLSLSALNIIRDENIEGVLALLQRVASVVAEEVTRASASAPVHVPLAVAEGRRFAEQHLGGRIALTDVARHVGLSADHFSRLFRCALGIPFGEYVNRCRVEHAQRILAGSSRRVAEVAYACGFESVPHFNRVFRRVTGTSPTRFRRPVPELQPTGASRAVVLF
jgi:transcriptional regulator GlxA family with amidase domain